MSAQSVQPLRIQKSSAGTSPTKANGLVTGRPLADLSPMAVRRNSPSFPQNNKARSCSSYLLTCSPDLTQANVFKGDSSPFDASPYIVNLANSPRLFWQGRDPTSPGRMSFENRSPHEQEQSPFPSKRSSIENLKKASRVKNSSMFAQEQKNKYDPSQPTLLDRPLASGRPLSTQFQGNAFNGRDSQTEVDQSAALYLSQTQPLSAPQTTSSPQKAVPPLSPSKNNVSPSKSSLSKKAPLHARSLGFDPDNGIWSDEEDSTVEHQLPEGRGLHRHAKSVTFDQAPPQVNEYEMTTPDPSSVASGSREGSYDSMGDDEEVSFERGSSLDHDDSFDASLEDTDKTPVVMPEDWQFMSPDIANTELAKHEEDVFDGEYGSPAPSAQPGPMEYRPHQTSVNSIDSNGQPRPLPPLPPTQQQNMPHAESDKRLSGTVERISGGQRFLPSPPQAPAVSKSEIRRMSGGSLSMNDRLHLLMLQDQQKEKSEAELQRERRMRRAGSKEPSPTREDNSHVEDTNARPQAASDTIDHNEAEPVPRISRESILRRLRSEQDLYSEGGFEDTPSPNASSHHSLLLDPDIPIPSVEDLPKVTVEEITENHTTIKEENADYTDLYSIPDLYQQDQEAENGTDDDDTSQYSQPSMAPQARSAYEEGQDTPRAQSPVREPQKKTLPSERVSLPDFIDFGQSSTFDLGLESYLTPSPPLDEKPLPVTSGQARLSNIVLEKPLPDLATLRDSIKRPFTPEGQLEPPHFPGQEDSIAEPGTPDSVIRHPVAKSSSPEFEASESGEPGPAVPSKDEPGVLAPPFDYDSKIEQVTASTSERPPIPDRHYKQAPSSNTAVTENAVTEPGTTPKSDNKRISSLVQLEIPRDQSDEALGFGLEKEFDRVVEAQKVAFELSLARLHHPFHGRFPSSELPASKDVPSESVSQSILKDLPNLRPQGVRALPGDLRGRRPQSPTDGSNFANRSPGRQRGYLMRQNTKVVVASNHVEDEPKPAPTTAEAGQTAEDIAQVPRKISQPTWTAEPWNNGKSRRRSIRGVDKSPRKKVADGPAPPLPGQTSNVQDALDSVQEDEIAEEEAEDFEDGSERGRLFVKVVGLKDLDLPLPREEHTHFALTLDNGLHCVTTAWLDLGRSATIGQEFELVVLNELEFQLTLQMKLEEPKPARPQSPTKAPASPVKKQGAFGRFFGSPKKRKELEFQKQQEAEARQSAVRPPTPPSAYELVQGLVAKDGTFARAYVALSEHEKQAFGRPYTVDITCFNEWATEEVSVGSSRSKKSVKLQSRPPYPIGKLELQMMYVPKPKGAKDEDMPRSMNSAIRELREAEAKEDQQKQPHAWEGNLSQQGGDCPYWRRRFFRLAGSKLTAYHESTLQPRATINLAKASKLIDDKSALTQKEVSTKGGRRKSAFAEEEEGYMFVEEGFRIRFANGEVIDFYADSAAEKDDWMKVLCEVVGKGAASAVQTKGWTGMVLKREKSIKVKEKKTTEAKPVPSSPTKGGNERRKQMQVHAPEMPVRPASARPASAREQPSAGFDFGGPSREANTQQRTHAPRPQGHMRTESYQPQSQLPQPTSRSQANSPVKSKNKVSAEDRRKKTRSMIDMMYH